MSLAILERAATTLGLQVVDGERSDRFYLTREGDVTMDAWVEMGRGGCFVLGPGFAYEEAEELLTAVREARKAGRR